MMDRTGLRKALLPARSLAIILARSRFKEIFRRFHLGYARACCAWRSVMELFGLSVLCQWLRLREALQEPVQRQREKGSEPQAASRPDLHSCTFLPSRRSRFQHNSW